MERGKAGKKFKYTHWSADNYVYSEVGGALIKLLMTAGSRPIRYSQMHSISASSVPMQSPLEW